MRQWKVVALLLATGLMVSSVASAQSNDDQLKREVDQLKEQVRRVMEQNAQITRENADLLGRMTAVETDDSLEQRINALSESANFAATTVDSGANPISITGEFRARSGWVTDRDFGAGNDGPALDDDAEDDEGSYTDARFRVAFDFTFDKNVKTHLSLQANGLYSNNGPTTTGSVGLGDIEMYEGWIWVGNIFGRKELTAKTGRQEFVLGNEFQFGNNDFFSGETHDGSHWMWSSDNFDLHFLFAKEFASEFLNPSDHPYLFSGLGLTDGFDDDELYSLYFTLKSIKDLELDLYWIYFNGHAGASFGTLGNHLGSASTGDSFGPATFAGAGKNAFDFYYHTFGIRLDGMFNVAAGLDYNIEFAYQTGNLSDGTNADVEGLALEAELGITFNANNHFRLFVRFLWAEGADNNDTGYIPLFPERHAQATNVGGNGDRRARYGILDIIPMDNVITVQLGLTFDPAAAWTLGITGIYAEHDEDVQTIAGNMSDNLGFEIDLFAEYRHSSQTTFSAGLGFFFPDDGAPLQGGGFVGNNDDDVTVLFYLQTRVTF
ncbi:MAG: alginate export family protein [Planctomycetes bacterium]|nr:alginate export family protein [Planctomycetota bacterium]